MQRVARSVFCLVWLGCVLICCWGCAGTGLVAPTAESGARAQGQEPSSGKPVPEGSQAKQADRLLEVRIQGPPESPVIVLTGNGPFRDYQFSRLGERQFALDLSGLDSESVLPELPPESSELKLNYANTAKGVEIIGTLEKPLDHYTLNNAGACLTLNLYVPEAGSASLASSSPSVQESREASRKSKHASSSKHAHKTAPIDGASAMHSAAEMQLQPSRPLTMNSGGVAGTDPVILRKHYTGKPISLDLMDADLRNVLRLLADVTGTNIVIEPDVAGRVTMKVEQVPWDQILDNVLAMNNLGMEQSGNVIRIARQGKLKDEWKNREEEIRAKQDLMEVVKDSGSIATEYLTVNYAQPVDMAAKITEMKSEKGKLSIDERTNLIIYTDYPNRIDNAKRLLARLDKAMPQVMIEARIVTMSDIMSRSLGVSWNLNFDDTQVNPSREFVLNLANAVGSAWDLNLGQVIGQTLLTLDLNLQALETTNKTKVIAAPKVLTLNNVQAVISQGTQIPYLQQSTEGGVVSTVFKDAVIELQVTPHITPDKRVRLEIAAKQDEPDTTVSTSTGDPGISTRKIKTELLVSDGSIIVIGGVMRDTEGHGLETTPGLGDIPLLGRLFKTENVTRNKNELLIFISPKIVEM